MNVLIFLPTMTYYKVSTSGYGKKGSKWVKTRDNIFGGIFPRESK